MKKIFIQLTLLSLFLICIGYAAAFVIESPTDQKTYFFKKPFEIINMFYKAVDHAELRAFDKTLSREMIIPIRVEYIYELSSPIPQINVHSEIIDPISIPADPNCKAGAITATLDTEGHILGTSVHVHFCD